MGKDTEETGESLFLLYLELQVQPELRDNPASLEPSW
jgi:hypothetical protein